MAKLGEKQSKETIAKRVAKMIGRKYPNRKLSEIHKKNIALARKREWDAGLRKMWKLTPEIIEKIRQKNLGRKTPSKVRIKQSLVRLNSPNTPRGEQHHSWKGGISSEIRKIRHSVYMKLWREAVFKRDNWTCQKCGVRGVTLNADHIKPFSLYPELRFVLENGRTLCKNCHLQTDTWGTRIKNYARQ